MADCIIIAAGPKNHETMSRIQRNLGAYRIASSLENSGYNCKVIDFTQYFSIQELINALSKILLKDTLWVGFSSTFFWGENNGTDIKFLFPHLNEPEVTFLFSYIRKNSNAKIIYGGIRANRPYYDDIDYYIKGYADTCIVDITNRIKNKLPIDKVIDSKQYPEPKMNDIKTHWWRKDFNILQGESLPLEMARGCIFKCKFCGYSLIGKKKGTYIRSLDEVREDLIRTWEATGCTKYYITDDTFNDDNDKIEMVHRLFTSLPFKINFSCYLRLDLINKYPHQADLLLESGLVGNFFGIETLNKKSGVAIGKGLEPNKVKDRLYWLKEKWSNKVNMGAGLIFGLPYDTPQYFDEVGKWVLEKDNPLSSIEIYPLMLFKVKDKNSYSSEFSMNPEIYGYEVYPNNFWTLKDQNLDLNIVTEYAHKIMQERFLMNKVSEFQILTQSNVGVPVQEIMNTRYVDLQEKFNMSYLNNIKLNQYKTMIGAINV